MKQSDIFARVGRHESSLNSLNDYGLWHPLSYYVLGGSDPTGEALRETHSTGFDSDEMISASGIPDSRTNPRISKWEIIEAIGVQGYENAVENAIAEGKPKKE